MEPANERLRASPHTPFGEYSFLKFTQNCFTLEKLVNDEKSDITLLLE